VDSRGFKQYNPGATSDVIKWRIQGKQDQQTPTAARSTALSRSIATSKY
jgi:hypothetical protein